MFAGWKLINDLKTLIQLKEGCFQLDFINNVIWLDDQFYSNELHMFYEISVWFDKDLADHNIDKSLIHHVKLFADFIITITEGKPKSKTHKVIALQLKMRSSILTDEKEYSAEKGKTIEYHYVYKK